MKPILTTLAFILLAASPAAAHPLLTGAGFAGGFAHPFLGWDHMLAMSALGLWLRVSKTKPVTAIATFLAAMAAGFVIAAFAVFHGHAHGTEAPLGASLLYAGGFILASAGIISASYMTTRLIKNETVARRIGIAIVAAGAVLGFAA
jgi:urease accessory protein